MVIVAIDLGGTKIAAAIVTERGAIRQRLTEPVDRRSSTAVVRQVLRVARRLKDEADSKVSLVGIAVPGLVRPDGRVWAPNLPGWRSVPLASLVRPALGVPVVVESDRNAAVLGESWKGAARGKRDVVVLMLGTGIGAGILSGGRIVRGAHELSGCAGWQVVTDRADARARRVGALESLAAGPALARHGRASEARDLASAARRGNRRARKLFADAAVLLGRGVGNIISLLNPEVVVLSGGLMEAADLFVPSLRRVALASAQPLAARKTRIVVSSLGADANLLGAARVAMNQA
jgi:glucokinase